MAADTKFYQPPPQSQSSEHPSNAARLRPFYSISGWTRLIQTMLFINMGFSIATIVLSLSAFEQVQNVHRSSQDARDLQQTGGAITTIQLTSLIPAAIMGLAFVA